MQQFTGETSNGVYAVTLIDNSVHIEYVELSGDDASNWEAQKTEFRMPRAGFFSIEDFMFGDIEPDTDENDSVSCRVVEGSGGEEAGLTVTLTNTETLKSVEWQVTPERVYGPLFTDKWGKVLQGIMGDNPA